MEEQVQFAYLAGLFDGEGSVLLSKDNSSQLFRRPSLSMTSTTLALLEICKDTFGGIILSQKVYKEHYKPSWTWKVRNRKAIIAIQKLLPFINEPEKKRKMELILSQYDLLTNRNGKYTELQKTAKLQFEQEFSHPSRTILQVPYKSLDRR